MKNTVKIAMLLVLASFLFGSEQSNAARVTKRSRAKGTALQPRVIYPKRTELDFEGIRLEGELRNPGEFYFQYRPEEKFDSLVQRRKNFHREMLRDIVLTK